MSGGQRIDDHGSWIGAKSKHSPFPDGPHKCKDESSASTSGSVMHYEDTTEAIRHQQMQNKAEADSKKMKPGYRN